MVYQLKLWYTFQMKFTVFAFKQVISLSTDAKGISIHMICESRDETEYLLE
jgi:hypothetical protein